jgi:two-component system response regulator CpxR
VFCADNIVELTGTEYSILHLLMVNQGNLVSKEEISEKVLGKKLADFYRSIDMHVSNLRKNWQLLALKKKLKPIVALVMFIWCPHEGFKSI